MAVLCHLWLLPLDYVSFTGSYFTCILFCICTMQPWSNIKGSHPVQRLVITQCLVWRLCASVYVSVCTCVCGMCTWFWHCHQSFQTSIHLCHSALRQITTQRTCIRKQWVLNLFIQQQHKDIDTISRQKITTAHSTDCWPVKKPSFGRWNSLFAHSGCTASTCVLTRLANLNKKNVFKINLEIVVPRSVNVSPHRHNLWTAKNIISNLLVHCLFFVLFTVHVSVCVCRYTFISALTPKLVSFSPRVT